MQKRFVKALLVCIALCSILAVSYAKLPPAAKILPPGFILTSEKDIAGTTMIITARKDNDNFPKHFTDLGISLEISWTMQPMADQVMKIMAGQPEAPAGMGPGPLIREEPCGKQNFQGGFYICRKIITRSEDPGVSSTLETWRVSWTGKAEGGLVNVNINNYYGSKGSALGLIQSIIPKLSGSK